MTIQVHTEHRAILLPLVCGKVQRGNPVIITLVPRQCGFRMPVLFSKMTIGVQDYRVDAVYRV